MHVCIYTGKYPTLGDNEWYFFTLRNKKNPKGSRPDRTANNGYWRATTADTPIKNIDGVTIGSKRSLNFWEGLHPNRSIKTDWIMHEFIAATNNQQPSRNKRDRNDTKFDDWALCRIHKRATKLDKKAVAAHGRQFDQEVQQLVAPAPVNLLPNFDIRVQSENLLVPAPAPAPENLLSDFDIRVQSENLLAPAPAPTPANLLPDFNIRVHSENLLADFDINVPEYLLPAPAPAPAPEGELPSDFALYWSSILEGLPIEEGKEEKEPAREAADLPSEDSAKEFANDDAFWSSVFDDEDEEAQANQWARLPKRRHL
ncbi:PREDICTED: NAC domain-containing protein 2-like [Erythranthe guttata]|uniref:NAC domain-containing protein 2-like n=1 Tax=Erythranthe guttata TaxID=4155 RepID=UPI00064DC567|nr:PREDICTED: NAC domain-containing protein 2-like [Erythranthe guttata]|eukprot:XP_012839499.1 PREDICTED: NAC domain-containing protein 2-like [Erythranthe guttata]